MDRWICYWLSGKYLEYGENWVGFNACSAAAFPPQDKANIFL
ncbi:hypothetical protein ACQ9LF_05605 [Anaerohalosphaeraceae bacterium U12dextr]